MKILRPDEVTNFPAARDLSAEELRQAYALARAAFTAEDLQRYTEEDEGIPLEDVLRELTEIQQRLEGQSQ